MSIETGAGVHVEFINERALMNVTAQNSRHSNVTAVISHGLLRHFLLLASGLFWRFVIRRRRDASLSWKLINKNKKKE